MADKEAASNCRRYAIRLSGGFLLLVSLALALVPGIARANAGHPLFLPPYPSYDVGYGSRWVASADLNSDGKQDLVTANYATNTVSVLLGVGDGTFGGRTDYVACYHSTCVAIEDLDGDTAPDLVTANYDSSTVSVLLNQGDGTFGARSDYDTAPWPRVVVIADLNGDLRLDLATPAGTDPGGISVLLGNGDGSFAARADYGTGSGATYAVAVADVDHDGQPDLLAANYDYWGDAGHLAVLLGNGDGNFAAHQDYPIGFVNTSLAVADLDGDGDPDAVTTQVDPYAHGSTFSVLLGDGDGSFHPVWNAGTGDGVGCVVAADLNGDGAQDLATANQGRSVMGSVIPGTVSVMLGNGDGTFGDHYDYGPGDMFYSVAVADFDGDGRNDLAAVDFDADVVTVFLNAGDFPVPALAALVSADAEPGRVTLRWYVDRQATSVVTVYRRTKQSGWRELDQAMVEAGSLVCYLDSAVEPGTEYGYCLGIPDDAGETLTGEVWVQIPAGFALALAGFRPNPAAGGLRIAFTLADDSPATVEVFAVNGRRVLEREVGSLGAGEHVIDVAREATMRPGVYWVRLTQAGTTLTRKGVLAD